MVMYHFMPVQESESKKIERALDILKGVIAREDKRHMMDEHLSHSMRDLLESEIIPQLENELNFDPTPQYLWDETGGEPPATLDEMHTDAYNRKYNQ
tara:strand:+ start:6026 stop:6316 length:291 start_codon:yes stop_codon:yes gene_type:complete